MNSQSSGKNENHCTVVGPLRTNCWLYPVDAPLDFSASKTAGQTFCAVIDPGDNAGLIIAALNKLNWIPLYILLTHGHIDHIAALPDLLSAIAQSGYSQMPKTGIHRLDTHYLGKNSLNIHRESCAAAGDPAFADALWKPMPEPDLVFDEGDIAGPFRVLHIPGHTPGSAGFYDEKAGVLFSGDTLFRGTWGRTDLPGGNETQIFGSLRRLLSLDGETVVCPGHGSGTTIKDETGLI